MVKVRNTLDRFLQRLDKAQKKRENIVENIAETAKQVAENYYAIDNAKTPVQISYVITGKHIKLTATGNGLAFREFGTGIRGKGTYDGTLPNEAFIFESPKGVPQTTFGWQYNYRKEQGQTTKDWVGFESQAQMFNTAQDLRRIYSKNIKGE